MQSGAQMDYARDKDAMHAWRQQALLPSPFPWGSHCAG